MTNRLKLVIGISSNAYKLNHNVDIFAIFSCSCLEIDVHELW